MKEPLIRV